jgi:hypothetical protein
LTSDDTVNTLQSLVSEISEFLQPITQGVQDEDVRREILLALGLDPGQAGTPVDIPPSSLASIDDYRHRAAEEADLRAFISVLTDITRITAALKDFITTVANNDPDQPPGFLVEEVWSFFLEATALGYLRVRQPGVYIAASALKLFEEQTIRYGGITQLLFHTADFFEELWGSANNFRTDDDAKRVSDVALFVVGTVIASLVKAEFVYGYDPDPLSDSSLADAVSDRTLMVQLSGKTEDDSHNKAKGSLGLGMALLPADHGGIGMAMRFLIDGSLEVPITKTLSFKIDSPLPDFITYVGDNAHDFPTGTDSEITFSLIHKGIRKADGEDGSDDGTGEGADDSTAEGNQEKREKKDVIWGDPKGIRVRFGNTKLEGSIGVKDQGFKFEVKDSAFVLATSETDGFLRTVLNAITTNGELETEFDFNLGFRKRKWFVGGGMGLMLSLPLHETLAIVKFNTLTLGIAAGDTAGAEPGIKIEASLSFGLDMGVLQASVDRVGLAGFIDFETRTFSLGFKPPNGVGLAIDAGPVSGGGLLIFDPDRQEYAGGLELDISGIVTVSALGLITTRMPDGSSGFSLLAILAVEFGTPIQLGLGFTWNGVGGIFGLNRTMRLEALASGIKSGAAERILFPHDIVANASRIISDLRTYFPPLEDTFLVGGMLKIGWGSPSVAQLSLGVVIQIPPGTFAILGVLKVALPDEDAAVLRLNVGFLGAYEPDRQRAWFYATLYDSRVLNMTIEGGMGLLVAWGQDSNFLVSAGGFHPQFVPPPLPFPKLDRLSINLLNQPAARIRVMAYFAVTSNTAQFGARAEVFFGFSAANIEGHLSLDVLFHFTPFSFLVEISASVSFKVFGAGLFTVRFRGSLEGPTPWRIDGKASISFFLFSVSVHLSKTWGETIDTMLPGVPVMPLITAQLESEANWLAKLPSGNNLLVSVRSLEESAELVLHPVGELVVSQRAVPLGVQVDKVGNQSATDANRFTLTVADAGLTKRSDQAERFAMAQYQDMSDTEKLALLAFQDVPGGIRLGVDGEQARSSRMVKRNVRYETIIIDTDYRRFVRPFFDFWGGLFNHFLGGAAVGKLEVSQKRKKELQPFSDRIEVHAPAFTVANVADNTPFAGASSTFASEALARDYFRQQIADEPSRAKTIHVIPEYEVNTA